MRNKRVVITGGAGLMGSSLACEIAANNNDSIVDDFSTGSMENVAGLIHRENVTLIKAIAGILGTNVSPVQE